MSEERDRSIAETVDFDGLTIRFDERVLRPRAWTAGQSQWAAELLETLPAGPVLELCAGAGHIGLAAVARSSRHLVAVDVDPVATSYAAANAAAAGVTGRFDVRQAPLLEALAPEESFVLVIADPPWVRRTDVTRFPEDPVLAIDGGPDGMAVARQCLAVIGAHLDPRGVALLQLGGSGQVDALAPQLEAAGLRCVAVREYDGGVVACLCHAGRPSSHPLV